MHPVAQLLRLTSSLKAEQCFEAALLFGEVGCFQSRTHNSAHEAENSTSASLKISCLQRKHAVTWPQAKYEEIQLL